MKYFGLLATATALFVASPAVAQPATEGGGDTSKCSKCELSIIGILSQIQDNSEGIKDDTAPIGAKLDALTAAVKELAAAVLAKSKKAPAQLAVTLVYPIESGGGTFEQQRQAAADKYCRGLGYAAAKEVVEAPVRRTDLSGNRKITSLTCYD